MANDFQSLISAGLAAVREVAGLAVIYRRGAVDVDMTATPGRTQFSVDGGAGVAVTGECRDWTVAAADLVIDGEVALPERGDRIILEVGGVITTYEVCDLGGERHYRPCDNLGVYLRIHTRIVGND